MIIDAETAKTFIVRVSYDEKTVEYADGRIDTFTTEAEEKTINIKIYEQVRAIEAEART